MPQQDGQVFNFEQFSNEKYIRRLFIQTDINRIEIANSKGYIEQNGYEQVVGRIVEEYSPPTPVLKVSETKISNGVSQIVNDGIASYRIGLRILINRYLFRDLIFFSKNKIIYFDEEGHIFSGVINEINDVKMVEAGRRYDVRLSLLCVKGNVNDTINFEFTDLYDVGYKIEFSPVYIDKTEYVMFRFNDFLQSYEFSYDTKINVNPSYFAYVTYQQMRNYMLTDYFTIRLDYTNGIIYLAPIQEVYYTGITIDTPNQILKNSITVSTERIYTWAKEDIDECARIGLFNYMDSNGNLVYTFAPKRFAKRSEMAAVFNRLLDYLDKSIS